MAELLQLEFNAPGAQGIYDKVNAALGFDPDSTASYPTGLLSHIVGLGAAGASIAVTEVWDSNSSPAPSTPAYASETPPSRCGRVLLWQATHPSLRRLPRGLLS